jgi:dihydrofolate synthase/folylpolyglutamate synthase
MSGPVSLADWLSYLESLHPATIDMGLARVASVAARLDIPRFPRVVTVSGTNGKGSCVAAIESIAMAQGLKVGAYTSPHLIRYNERIRINGESVDDERITDAFRRIERARGEVSLTYFEFGTLAALLCFADVNPDIVVLEVGLGGRLDAVNIIDAEVAVITSIDLDHQHYLGDTRESVCFEKAGIRRRGHPLICGDRSPPGILEALCRESSTPLLRIGRDFEATEGFVSFLCGRRGRVSIAVQNPCLIAENLGCALQALACTGLELDLSRCSELLSSLRVPGRRQRLKSAPDVFVDVGHNPHAARDLARWWSALDMAPSGRRWAVVGMMSDKDVEGSLEPMMDLVDAWVTVDLPPPRGLTAAILAQRLNGRGCMVSSCEASPDAGLNFVLDHASADDSVIIFGSFLMVTELLVQHDR